MQMISTPESTKQSLINPAPPQRIAIVAGELSGDVLGGALISELRKHFPLAEFVGIGGPRMIEAGLESRYPLETLSVMGLVEVLRHLPRLLKVRRTLVNEFTTNPPDLFLGIDAPDFVLPIAHKLKLKGVKTAHYVSPSVWAWRQGRVKSISESVDLMLTLFPFEADFYRDHAVPVEWVGHPLADELSEPVHAQACREKLQLVEAERLLAILPGSRGSEIRRLAPLFFDTVAILSQRHPAWRFAVPCATSRIRAMLETLLSDRPNTLPITLINAQSRAVLGACDAALVASGTATLEAMLLKRPMVMAYKVAPLTALIAARLVKLPYFALPNLLAGKQLVPEFLQEDAQPQVLAKALEKIVEQGQAHYLEQIKPVADSLRRNASERAAQALADLIERGRTCV